MDDSGTIGWLVLGWAAFLLGVTGCTDPDACQTDEDCFQGQFCADDDRCTPLPGGDGDGGTTGGGSGSGTTGGDADMTGSGTGGSSSGGSGSDVGSSDGDASGTGGTGGSSDAGGSGGSGTVGGDSGSQTHRYVDVSSGEEHSCGLLDDGRVICWGGPDEIVDNVPTGKRFTQIESGDDLACGRTVDDKLECWGNNTERYPLDPDLPTDIAGRDFAVGTWKDSYHRSIVCVQNVPQGSTADCYVTSKDRNFSGSVSGPIEEMVVGFSYVCLSTSRGFNCGPSGPSGDDDFTPPANPSKLACYDDHCCAVDPAGSPVDCFGYYVDEGQRFHPPEGTFDRVATGFSYVCARYSSDHSVTCWGDPDKQVPEAFEAYVADDPPVVSKIAGGKSHVCVLRKSNGVIDCWGEDADQQTAAPVPAAAVSMLNGQ